MSFKRIIAVALALFAVMHVKAQPKYFTKTGKIVMFSAAPMENIEASNKSAIGLLDTKTGDFQFAALLKGFEFKKALMQEHFNSDYVESDKYPKSEFKGQISNNSAVNYSVNGTYNVTVKGKLSLHGESKDIEVPGTITVKDGKLAAHAIFNILLSDYKVSIPKLYTDNISKTIKITVDASLDPLNN